MTDVLDVIVVGGGPAGLSAGARAARRGLSHVVLERGELANTIFEYQLRKLVMAEPQDLPLYEDHPLSFEEGPREEILDVWRSGVARVDLRLGPANEVTAIAREEGAFRLSLVDGSALEAHRVVLAIGVRGNANRFGVEGDELDHVAYRLDDPAAYSGKHVVIVGGGDSATENAVALAENATDASIVTRGSGFDRANQRNRDSAQAAIKSGGVEHFRNSAIRSFEPGRVLLGSDGHEYAIDADLVIGQLGARPPRAFLQEAGLQLSSDTPRALPTFSAKYESSIPGLYVIGSLTGSELIKSCMNQGYEVIEHIVGEAVVPPDERILLDRFRPFGGTMETILARVRADASHFDSLNAVELRSLLFESELELPLPGEVVFERYDYADDLYSILEGSVEVFLPATDRDRDAEKADNAPERKVVQHRGQFVGEGALISGRRRAARVEAGADCKLLKTSRYGLVKLTEPGTPLRDSLDRAFIFHFLSNASQGIETPGLAETARQAEFRQLADGELLFGEGDEPDGLYMIRNGAVSVARNLGAEEVVFEYVQAGNFVGEMALLEPGKRRTGTLRACVPTEVIFWPKDAILPLLAATPDLLQSLRRTVFDRAVSNVARIDDRPGRDALGFILRDGGGDATDMLLIDESLCTRCNLCETACAQTHGGVSRLDREAGPTVGNLHIPSACRHCENPRCMSDCPPDAIRRHPDGQVYITDTCISCGNCERNCPYGVITMGKPDPEPLLPPSGILGMLLGTEPRAREGPKEKPVKCDLCSEHPANEGRDPKLAACVEACPTGAIIRVDPREYVDQ